MVDSEYLTCHEYLIRQGTRDMVVGYVFWVDGGCRSTVFYCIMHKWNVWAIMGGFAGRFVNSIHVVSFDLCYCVVYKDCRKDVESLMFIAFVCFSFSTRSYLSSGPTLPNKQ